MKPHFFDGDERQGSRTCTVCGLMPGGATHISPSPEDYLMAEYELAAGLKLGEDLGAYRTRESFAFKQGVEKIARRIYMWRGGDKEAKPEPTPPVQKRVIAPAPEPKAAAKAARARFDWFDHPILLLTSAYVFFASLCWALLSTIMGAWVGFILTAVVLLWIIPESNRCGLR